MGAKTRKLSQINDSLIEWQSVVIADGSTGLTAVAGRGYFINTTAGAITVTFPASPKIGDTIIINDYASTFATNNVTINFNGNKLEADTINAVLSTNDQTHTFVFTDATQGWKIVNQDTGAGIQPLFILATGGTVTTSGDFKTHVFTGDGCFAISTIGNPIGGGDTVEYLVVAGGGSGGNRVGGGGGAGGYRQNYPSPTTGGLPISVTTYPITVGAGGSGSADDATFARGPSGSNSSFSTITSSGGGAAGSGGCPGAPGLAASGSSGGSGGGASYQQPVAGGAGNTPPTSPPQGNNGGAASSGPTTSGAGGGGAGAVGAIALTNPSGNGGIGSPIATDFFGPTAPSYGTSGPAPGRYFAGGGSGGGQQGVSDVTNAGTPNSGGGGSGRVDAGSYNGVANTGGGGGGGGLNSLGSSGGGGLAGKGIVVIRYKFQ